LRPGAPRRAGGKTPQTKTPPFVAGSSREVKSSTKLAVKIGSGGNAFLGFVRLTQHIAAAPHGLDEVTAFGSVGELLAQLADEDVDDLQLGFVHAAIEMVE